MSTIMHSLIQQLMSKNQYVSVAIFDQVIDNTKDYPHTFKQYQMKRPRLSLPLFWIHLVESLSIDHYTEFEAARLVWKLSRKQFKISRNLLYKLATVCLMLAEKYHQDETNTLQAISMVSGVSMKDLKSLQVQALSLLDFNLNLSESERQVIPRILFSYRQFQS